MVLLPFLERETCGYTPGWGAYSEYAVVGDAESYTANGMGEGTKEWSEGYFAQTVIKPADKVDAVGGGDDHHFPGGAQRDQAVWLSAQ